MSKIEDIAVAVGNILDSFNRHGDVATAKSYNVHPATVRALIALCRKLGFDAPRRPSRPQQLRLRPKQSQVVALRRRGLNNSEIGQELGMSRQLVAYHLSRARKAGASFPAGQIGRPRKEPGTIILVSPTAIGTDAWWQARGF